MKYLAIFDDDMLSNFRLDDGGLTLVLKDKTECTRAVELKPIEDGRPTLIYKGQVVYLTDEHIQTMAEWEKEQMMKEVLEQLQKTIDGLSDFDLDFEPNDTKTHFPKTLDGLVYQNSFCPHAHNCIEYFGSHCTDRCPLKNKEDTNCIAERVINFIDGESKEADNE